MLYVFQNTSKSGKKTGDNNYYTKYVTQRGGKGACIDLINVHSITFFCHIISRKIIHHYTKGECVLDTISVVEASEKGE